MQVHVFFKDGRYDNKRRAGLATPAFLVIAISCSQYCFSCCSVPDPYLAPSAPFPLMRTASRGEFHGSHAKFDALQNQANFNEWMTFGML